MADPMFAGPGQVPETNPHPMMGGDTLPPELPPGHPAAPQEPPQNFVERLTGLAEVHPWMSHQTMATVATINANDRAIAEMASTLRQRLGSVDNAVAYVMDDPLLQKTPSLALYLRSYLTNTLGPLPIADAHLPEIQRNLQKQGFGRGLQPNGVWNSSWNGAYTQWTDDLRTKQLGGSQPGSMPVGEALRALNQILPVQASTSIGAFVGHLKDSVVQDLRTLAGAVGGEAANVQQFGSALRAGHFRTAGADVFGNPAPNANEYSAAAENLVPGAPPVTPEQSINAMGNRQRTADVLQVVGDLIATHGLLRAGGAVADAAGDTKWTKLDPAAAQRGPGTIAKKFFGHKGVSLDYAKPLLSRGAAENVPILRMAGPVADKIAGGDGYYYRARTLLAAPYAVPGVKVLGTAVVQGGLAGAKIRGAASLESLVGGPTSPESQAIDRYQTINQFNEAVQNKFAFTAWGHHFAPSLNDLAWVMHPPMDSLGTISASIGSDMTNLNDRVQSMFGPRSGFGMSVQRGVNWTSHGDQKISYDDMVTQAGGPAAFAKFWSNKILAHAAVHLAEDEVRHMPPVELDAMVGPGLQFHDPYELIADLANGYRNRAVESGDWGPLMRGVHELMSDTNIRSGRWGGHNGLSKRIAAEIDRTSGSPRDWLQGNMANYSKASKLMSDVFVPRRGEVIGENVPIASMGMARADYVTAETAHADINKLEEAWKTAQASGNFNQMGEGSDAIIAYASDKFGIDGNAMPHSEEDLIKLLRQKADGQASALFPREHPLRIQPTDEKPHLKGNRPPGPGTLERHTTNPMLTIVSPTTALDLIHEDPHGLFPWTNDRRLLPTRTGGVVIEHDPTNLHGEEDTSHSWAMAEEARGSARFDAQRNDVAGFEGIRSVEIKKPGTVEQANAKEAGRQQVEAPPGQGELPGLEQPPKGGNSVKQAGRDATARRILETQLEQAGYIKFSGKGSVTYVRPDLVGGTIPASPELKAAWAQLKELGYKPVLGKGIGFDFYNHPIFDLADSKIGGSKAMLEHLGLSPENVPSADIGFTWNLLFHEELIKAAERYEATGGKKGLALFPTHSPETIIAMMHDRDALPVEGGLATAIQHTVGHHTYKVEFDRRTQELMGHGMNQDEAQKLVAQRMTQEIENPMGLVHMTKGNLRNILSVAPKEGTMVMKAAERAGKGVGPMYDDRAIDEIYRAIVKANGRMPTRLIGWQKSENLLALGLSYAGRRVGVAGAPSRALEYLPTRLVTLRNKARFTLSPLFQARRIVKTMVKESMDGVPPTFFPMRSLMRDGIEGYKAKMSYLDHVAPWLKNPNYDEGTQAMYASDPWGLFIPRNHEAYAAWHWKQMGKTDTEVRELIVKDFGYGSKAYGEGRAALERSMNFVFFPFSFDKTLYRNSGAYLLDHTAERLMLQEGLAWYQRYNNSDPNGERIMSSTWWKDRAPIIQQALLMNAFAHGLGLGQFGGINAPLLNLVIPQSYASSSQGVTLLRGILPIIREFQQLYMEGSQTWNNAYRIGADQFIHIPALHGFKGQPLTPAQAAAFEANPTAAKITSDLGVAQALQSIFYAKPVAETTTAQLNDAYQYRRKLTALFRQYIDANAHSTSKYTLGSSKSKVDVAIYGRYAGHIINATLVDYLAHDKYPAFAPDEPSIFYAQQAQVVNDFLFQMQGQHQNDVVKWVQMAQKMDTAIYNGKVDTRTAAVDTQIYRHYAILFAETIPGFLTFYNKVFRHSFGPLTGVR